MTGWTGLNSSWTGRNHDTGPRPPHFDGVITCRVLEVEPPVRLAYPWSATGVDTTVRWTLTPVDGGVHLRLEQSGLPAREANFQGAVSAWTGFLAGLEVVVDRL